MQRGIHTPLRWRRVWSALKRLRAEYQLAGVFSFFCSETAFVGHYFARRYNIPHYIWVCGQDARKNNNQVRRIRPSADELVCMSDFLVDEFERNHHIRPAHVIPNCVDTSLFGLQTLPREIDLLGAGSLIPLKQFDKFIAVVAEVRKVFPQIKAQIAGAGPEEANLKQLTQSQNLDNQLHLTGRMAHSTLLETMKRCRVLLHTSAYEGFPTVCLEALYAGAHVISFFKPMHYPIQHWHIVRDEAEMARKAIELLQDNALNHSPVLPFEVNETARRIMELFSYSSDSAV
jgi:glycosyltransferase involved in cell wall biosynthesis